jgi:hypothetical protein
MIYTKKEIYFKMSQDNVLSLNAFGEIIEPKGKRQYPAHSSPEPKVIQDVIPLTRVTPGEKPEFLPEPNSEEIKGRDSRGSKQANQVAGKVLIYIAQTKLLHWETKSRAEHEALDDLFKQLSKIGDKLVESVMGKYGRPELTQEDATFTLSNYENPENPDGLPRFINNIDNCFRNECSSLFSQEKDPEIHNIIQEILGIIDNTSYLLTLRK